MPHPPMNTEDFLHVSWDPTSADRQVAVTHRRFVSGIIGLVVTLLLFGGLYWWSHRDDGPGWSGTGQWTVAGVVVGLSVLLLVLRFAHWRLAVRHRRSIGEGEVITASWPGLQVAGHFWDWEEVGGVRTLRGGATIGDRYVVETPQGPWTVEVDDLAVKPATLAAALQRYSRGRCPVVLDAIAH